MGIVEGLTEFLPVSSTGHMIIVGHVLGFEGQLADVFDVFVQLGAILSVVFIYKERFADFLLRMAGISTRDFLSGMLLPVSYRLCW